MSNQTEKMNWQTFLKNFYIYTQNNYLKKIILEEDDKIKISLFEK